MPELSAARDAYKRGQLDESRSLLEAAKEKTPNLPPAELMLARLHFAHNRPTAGKSLMEKVAIDHADHPEVYLVFGNLAVSEKRLTDAQLHFEKALVVGIPSSWSRQQQVALQRESFAGQAAVAEQRADWFKAQVALKQLAKFEPAEAKIRDRLGAALFMLGREQEALEQFQTAARLDPTMNHPEVSMAVMHVREGDFSKAKRMFQRAMEKYPNDGRVCYEAAGMFLMLDETEKAMRLANKAAELGHDTQAQKMQRGYIARQHGEFEVAEQCFSEVLAEAPTHFEASSQLALVLAEQDDAAKQARALELATLNVKQYPRSSYAVSTLGWVYYKLGRTDEARRALQVAARHPTVRSETLYFLARLLWETGSKEDAREVAARVKKAVEKPGLFVLRPEVKKWFSESAIN